MSSSSKEPKLISVRDLFGALSLAAMLPVAWLVPERRWRALTHRLVSLGSRLPGGLRPDPPGVGDRPPSEPRWDGSDLDYAARVLRAYAATLKHYRPGRWTPQVRLLGGEQVQAALDRGRGAILWVLDCHGSNLAAKVAFAGAGHRVAHLSRPGHGASSDTVFARACLSPLLTRVEDRYLDERVVISRHAEVAPLAALRRRLENNGVVSITVTNWGLRHHSTQLADGSWLTVAVGAPRLALLTGAALLPVTTLQRDDGLVVIAGAPLEAGGGDRSQRLDSLVAGLAREVDRVLRDQPEQWRGRDLIAEGPSG